MTSEPGTAGSPSEPPEDANDGRARSMRTSERSRAPCGWLALALARHRGSPTTEDPAQWLERMNQALTTRNYDGTFTHWQGGTRGDAAHHPPRRRTASSPSAWSRSTARAASSSAPAPTSPAICPTSARCWSSSARRRSPLVGFPSGQRPDRELLRHPARSARTRYNRRDTHVITVTPKDEYRYGYRLWIDESTAMPLQDAAVRRARPRDRADRVRELKLSSRIPDAAFKPDVSTAGFQWLRNDARAAAGRRRPRRSPGTPCGCRRDSA